ncbi:MAG: gliding motility-associated C-terminal domain-containing protein, partial [Saprospiraceae bacterium]|nr:gliding motility-associated C-terminal domain-containing protein [Saprospiraceae bacterium]
LNLPPVSGALLGSGDTLLYILNQNPAQLPAGIFATAASPQFSLQPGMQAGTVYYVSAVAGNVLPNGSIDFTDPCLDIAPAVPVVFRQPPTASIFGDTTICRSSNTLFRITFTGKSPYQFVYSINGVQQTAVSAPQNLFTITTNNVQQSQLFQLVSVQDAYCPGTVSGSYTVNIQNGPTAKLLSNTSICPGDTALLRLQLTGASLFDLTIDGGPTPLQLNGVQNGATFSVTPAATTSYSIGAFSAQGNTCADTIGPGVTVTVAPALLAQATLSDYGGFNVSCPGETDGSISLAVSGGLGAATANWSNGNTGFNLQNLSAGTYSVSLTDTLGCSIQDSFTLTGPEPLQINYSLENPRCHNEATGVLRLLDIQGGLGPFALSLNGQTAQVIAGFPQAFQNLAAGAISLAVEDVNGCATQIDTSLANPPLFTVQLGPDATLYPGDSVFLNPVLTGAPVDSLLWTPAAGLNTPTELNTFAQPANTVLYKLWVQDTAGCQASDELRITVRKDYRFYAPTVFQPGARAPNHLFTFYAGPEVRNIRIVRIYDRWGGLVFDRQNVTPNHSDQGWDGRWNGQDVGPGVYIWMAELELADGATELKSGDVTVLR